MAAHSSILAWKIPWTDEPGGLQSMGLQRVRSSFESIGTRCYRVCMPPCWNWNLPFVLLVIFKTLTLWYTCKRNLDKGQDLFSRVRVSQTVSPNNLREHFQPRVTSLPKLCSHDSGRPWRSFVLTRSCSSFRAKCVCSHPEEHDMCGNLIINTIRGYTCQVCIRIGHWTAVAEGLLFSFFFFF